MSKQVLVREVRAAVVGYCNEKGVTNPKDIRKIMKHASAGVGKMSMAGIQAAISKGQNIMTIEKMPSTNHC